MHRFHASIARLVALLSLVGASRAGAQAWAYPSFQVPRVTSREFNFGVADAGFSGTSLIFQWREQSGVKGQLSLDAGLADRDARNGSAQLFVGGQYAYQLARSNADVPFDFLFTAGANASFGDFSVLRIPVGLSLGHRFELDGGMAITPYIHPRVSFDFCSRCNTETDLGVNFDLGGSFELSRALALRASMLFAGSEQFSHDGFGLSIAWTPPGLKH